MKILNRQAIYHWIFSQIANGHKLTGIKGFPSFAMRYSDGTLITNPVNIAWKNIDTGEIFYIEYAPETT